MQRSASNRVPFLRRIAGLGPRIDHRLIGIENRSVSIPISHRRRSRSVVTLSELEDGDMIEPKLEVPAELRDLAEKTIDQAEKAFGMFFDAAGKSMTSIPGAGTEISRQALSFTEKNMKAAFDHARKLVHATDLQEAMRIQ